MTTTATKTLRAVAGALYAKEDKSKYGPQLSGKDQHLALYKADGFDYSGAFKFDLGAAGVWDGVLDVSKAVIRFTNVARGSHNAARGKSGFQLRRLSKNFEDNSKEEGEWEEPAHDAVIHLPSFNAYKNGVMVSTTVGATVDVDITDWLRSWAPKKVKVKGKAGLAGRAYGFWVVRRGTSQQHTPQIVWGSGDNDDDVVRPQLILTYKTGDVKGSTVLTGPASPIAETSGTYFEGSYIAGVEGARLSRVHIRVFRRKADNTGWEDKPAWENGTTGEVASASEVVTGDWVYPLTGSAAHPLPLTGSTALFVSGKRYAWQAQCQSNKGVWTDYTALTELDLNASAPVFETYDIRPNGSPLTGAYSPTSSETLLNVRFGGTFRASGGNLTHGLMAYRVQVRDETDPSDPNWDAVYLPWDTGEVPVPTGTSDFGSEYKGASLPAGVYSFRVKVTNTAGVESPWRYGTFELTVGQDSDPSGNSRYLTGYARRQPRVRIRLRSIDANPQRILVNATGGYFLLSYDGHKTGEFHVTSTGDLSATIQTALRALPGIGNATTVTRSGASGKYVYTVTFAGPGTDTIPLLKWVKAASNHALTGGTKKVTITVASSRRPGRTVALIDDAANIGASEYYNSPGELYFTLPHTHPQISAIEPWATHYALEFHRGNGWEEVASGLIHDFDANDNDVVFYGFDYIGVLNLMIDERFNPLSSPKAKAYLYGETVPAGKTDGSYYENRTIKQIVTDQIDRAIHGPDSPLGFFSRGPIADMTENIIIYCTFKPRLQFITGLLESWKGKATESKRTRIRARHTISGGYEFRVDDNPGFDRPNLRMEYGGLVNGFRIIPYGTFGTRVNAIGQEIGSSQLQYTTALTPTPPGEDADYNEKRYGRWPTTNLWQDITDKADLSRRARQFARSLGRVGKQVALGIRVDAMMLKDGWDICDSIPVHIRRGVIDTTLYGTTDDGESYWTIWGWVFKVSPDGHTDLTLSILPKENATAAADDITPSAPILSNLSEWALVERDPTADDADGSTRKWTNTATGETFMLDPETGEWVSLTATMIGKPGLLASGNVVSDYIASSAVVEDKIAATAVSEGKIAPLAVTTTKLGEQAVATSKIALLAVDTAQMADNAVTDVKVLDEAITPPKLDPVINPIINVLALPTLPAAGYPVDSLVYNFDDGALYKNILQGDGVTQTWTKMEGVPGPQGSIPSYPAQPDVPTHVTGLPALPDVAYPVGTTVWDTVTAQNYVNVAEAWQAFDFDITDPLYFDSSTGLLMKWDGGSQSYKNIVNTADLTGTIQGYQIAADSILSSHIQAGQIGASEIASSIVLASIFRTALSGQRIEFDTAGFRAFDAANAVVVNIPTAGSVVTINAAVIASALTSLGAEFRGTNTFYGSSVTSLSSGSVSDPAVAPTVVDSLDYLTLAGSPTGSGIFYDSAGGAGGATASFWVGADPSGGGAIAYEYDASTGALLRTLNPSNTSSTTTETVGSTSHVSDTAQAYTGAGYNSQVATPITIPTRTGTIKVTAVSFYAAGYGGSCGVKAMLWNSTGGTLLGSCAEFTMASATFNNGNSAHYNKSLSSPVTVTSGQVVRAGFARNGEGFQYDRDDGASKTTYRGDGDYGAMSGVSTDTASKPNVYITIQVTNTVTVEGTMGKIVGVARAGSYLWFLDSNGKLFQYNQATLAYVAQFDMSSHLAGVKANGGMFYDGTNLCLLSTTAAAGASTINVCKVSTAGAYVSNTVGAAVANAATVVLRGGYNDGTNCWLYNSESAGVTAYDKTTYAAVANRVFGTDAECAAGVTFTTVFRARGAAGNKVYTYTAWDWATATNPYWFSYAYYKTTGGAMETAQSPRFSLTVGRRRRVNVTTPALPAGTEGVRVYMAPSAGDPGATGVKRQTDDALTGRYISSYNSGGTAGLGTTSFSGGTPAELKSQTTGWSLKGDGTAAFGALSASGTAALAAITGTDATLTGLLKSGKAWGFNRAGAATTINGGASASLPFATNNYDSHPSAYNSTNKTWTVPTGGAGIWVITASAKGTVTGTVSVTRGGIVISGVEVSNVAIWPLGGTNVGDSTAWIGYLADGATISFNLGVVNGTSASMSLESIGAVRLPAAAFGA